MEEIKCSISGEQTITAQLNPVMKVYDTFKTEDGSNISVRMSFSTLNNYIIGNGCYFAKLESGMYISLVNINILQEKNVPFYLYRKMQATEISDPIVDFNNNPSTWTRSTYTAMEKYTEGCYGKSYLNTHALGATSANRYNHVHHVVVIDGKARACLHSNPCLT